MKTNILFITAKILFFLSLFLVPFENKADTIWTITQESLISGFWGTDIDDRGMDIKFTRDGKFESTISWGYGQSGTDVSGIYTIKNGRVTLLFKNSSINDSISGVELEDGTPGYDPGSLKYRRYISFKGKELQELEFGTKELKIWDYNSKVEEGESLTINGFEAVAMGLKMGLTTSVLKMRKAPSAKAEQLQYTYEEAGDDQPHTVKALPLGTPLKVIARTKNKERVGKWNNYWYYVEFETYYDYMRAWVYGEFVKIE